MTLTANRDDFADIYDYVVTTQPANSELGLMVGGSGDPQGTTCISQFVSYVRFDLSSLGLFGCAVVECDVDVSNAQRDERRLPDGQHFPHDAAAGSQQRWLERRSGISHLGRQAIFRD